MPEWPHHPGATFLSWKNSTFFVPKTFYDADLMIHLEGDGCVLSYRPLALTCQDSKDSPLCYEVHHESGSYTIALLDAELDTAREVVVQQLAKSLDPGQKQVVLVSPSYLHREPRWTNVRYILTGRSYKISFADRLNILDYVDTYGKAEIEACAALCRSSHDPVEAVFALLAEAKLKIDLERRLSLASLVSLSQEQNVNITSASLGKLSLIGINVCPSAGPHLVER
jgi:hypothetical protein